MGRLEGTRWLGPHNPPSPSSRSTTSFSLSLFLLLSLSVLLPLRLPHDPSPRRVAGRPAGHQKSRLSEFQPESVNAWLSLPRRGRPYRSFPVNVRGDPRTPLNGCVWSRSFFLSRWVPCDPITGTTRSMIVVRAFGVNYSRSRPNELTPISRFAGVS